MWAYDNQTAVVVMAHPDDAEIGCFGTMMRLRQLGWRVCLLIVGSGEFGISIEDRSTLGHAFEKTKRLKESVASFADTGVELESLLLEDGTLTMDRVLISSIEAKLKQWAPSVVITHAIEDGGLDHQDHAAVARSTMNATVRLKSVRLVLHSEPHLSRIPFEANLFVDITEHHQQKLDALACHESQAGRIYLSKQYHDNRGSRNAHKAGTWMMAEQRMFEAFRVALQVV